MLHDLIIIGAGPAGLAAALDAAYLKLNTLVIDAGKAGGALSQGYPWKKVDSFLGFRGMLGKEVAGKIVDHVLKEGVQIREMEAVEYVKAGKPMRIKTKKSSYECSAVIVATGLSGTPRKLSVPGENLRGVEYFLQDPKKFNRKRVIVVGGGDSAVDSALGLHEAGAKVWLAHRKDELRAIDENKEKIKKSGVGMLWNTEIDSVSGEEKVEKVTLFNNKSKEKRELACDNVLICIGYVPAKEWLEGIGIKMTGVRVAVDDNGMTNVPGIFAAGDIVSEIKRIPQALATGESAAYSVYKYIKNPYWK